jgi:dynein light intermediate chain, axonemal
VAKLESDKRDLEQQVNEQKSRCDQIEKKAMEQKAVQEKQHQEEVQFLKRTNQQLKVHAPTILHNYILTF